MTESFNSRLCYASSGSPRQQQGTAPCGTLHLPQQILCKYFYSMYGTNLAVGLPQSKLQYAAATYNRTISFQQLLQRLCTPSTLFYYPCIKCIILFCSTIDKYVNGVMLVSHSYYWRCNHPLFTEKTHLILQLNEYNTSGCIQYAQF